MKNVMPGSRHPRLPWRVRDGRDKPGHDEFSLQNQPQRSHHGQSSRPVLFRLRSHRGDGECRRARRARKWRYPSTSARARAGDGRRWQKARHYKLDQAAPVAKVEELVNYDAIIVGTGTRFGRMSADGELRSGRRSLARWARCTARSAAPSPRPRPSMAARRPRRSRSSPNLCTSA